MSSVIGATAGYGTCHHMLNTGVAMTAACTVIGAWVGSSMFFNDDMNFISKSEGKQENGIYIFNRNGAYIVMTDENGETLKANIISLTKKHLVLTFDIEEMRAIEVHYNSTIK